MRVFIMLAPLLLVVVFMLGVLVGKILNPEERRVRRLEAENANLRQDESTKLKEAREELQEYSDMTDNVVAQLGRQANGLDVTTTAQHTLQYITTTRPRRSL